MISKALDYALRASIYMASNPAQEYFCVTEISNEMKVSTSYLAKILQSLVKKKFMLSVTGPKGGFALARNPEEISILDLIKAIDGDKRIEKCYLRSGPCDEKNPCPVHTEWKKCKETMNRELANTTIAQAINKSWPGYKKVKKKISRRGK